MRRNPHIGVWIPILTFFTIPLQYIAGEFNEGIVGLFLVVKAYSVAVPCIGLCLIRLGHSIDVNVDNNEIRQKQSQLYKKYLPKWVITRVIKPYFTSERAEKNFGIFLYIFLCINIIEAMIFESLWGISNGNVLNWSRIFNIIAGFFTLITIPLPISLLDTRLFGNDNCNYKFGNIKFWHCDIKSDYTDLLMYLPNNKYNNYIGILWLLLYCSWNVCYSIRFFTFAVINVAVVHIGVPLIRSIIGYKYGMFVQSRAYILWMFITIIIAIREDIFQDSGTFYAKPVGNGWVLMIWSVINCILGIVTTWVWWFWYKPNFDSKDVNNNLVFFGGDVCKPNVVDQASDYVESNP